MYNRSRVAQIIIGFAISAACLLAQGAVSLPWANTSSRTLPVALLSALLLASSTDHDRAAPLNGGGLVSLSGKLKITRATCTGNQINSFSRDAAGSGTAASLEARRPRILLAEIEFGEPKNLASGVEVE